MGPARPHSHCPGCGQALAAQERYPWRFCQACLERAEDGGGQRLVFANTALSGGLAYRRAGDPRETAASAVLCRIDGRPVIVTEARFGGIVAQPFGAPPPDAIDLIGHHRSESP